jgi:hypothetical protein
MPGSGFLVGESTAEARFSPEKWGGPASKTADPVAPWRSFSATIRSCNSPSRATGARNDLQTQGEWLQELLVQLRRGRRPGKSDTGKSSSVVGLTDRERRRVLRDPEDRKNIEILATHLSDAIDLGRRQSVSPEVTNPASPEIASRLSELLCIKPIMRQTGRPRRPSAASTAPPPSTSCSPKSGTDARRSNELPTQDTRRYKSLLTTARRPLLPMTVRFVKQLTVSPSATLPSSDAAH